MNKEKILEYVMKTPHNTNYAVMESMLISLLKENKVAENEENLIESLKEGKDVIVNDDIIVTSQLLINSKALIDLNKNSITAADNNSNWYMLKAEGADAILTISGDGVVSAGNSTQAIPVTAANGGKVIINGGTFYGKGALQCVYANGGKVEIYSGTFGVVEGEETKDLLNVQNTHEVTDIQVYGGRFIGRDPALGDDALGGSFVAPGYKSIEVEPGIFEVIKA